MDKDILKQKLEETKAKLKANSNDAHFTDALISEMLSLKTQLLHEPTLVHIPMSDISDVYKGDTFEISVTNDGQVVYHIYGGYTLIADPRMVNLNQTLRWLIESLRSEEDLSDEEKDDLELVRDAMFFVLMAPSYAFTDDELTFGIARLIIEHLNKLQDEMLSAEIPAEDAVKNSEFEVLRTGAN